MDWEHAAAELAKPLDTRHVKPAKQNGPKGDYIEAWHAQAEANRIFGYGAWSQEVAETVCVAQEVRPIGREKKQGWGVTYTARVRITVDGVVREDFGAGHGYDLDLGLAHESAIKEAVSDAMKRALKSFGNPFGLALYDKSREHVADVQGDTAKVARDRQCLEAAKNLDTLAATFGMIYHEWGKNPPAELVELKNARYIKFVRDDLALCETKNVFDETCISIRDHFGGWSKIPHELMEAIKSKKAEFPDPKETEE